MSLWIENLTTRLEDRPVIILHGNVRDRYIDGDGRVYDNLTVLLREMANRLPIPFSEVIFYDPVGGPRPPWQVRHTASDADSELDEETGRDSERGSSKMPTPNQVFAKWNGDLSAVDRNRFVVLFYLDKLIAYKASYQEEEQKLLLRLEKIIENITPNHRLILVALQDTLVPIELYTNSPKTIVLPIPAPTKADRLAYLTHRLGEGQSHLDLIADLTDGLFLRDLDNIASALSNQDAPGVREVRRLVNKYRIGEQEDYFGNLSIERLDGALNWFVDVEGVKGQEEAIRKVRDVLVLARAGLSGMASGTVSKPKGVLFFAGPTGVGKTLVAKKLAKFLFGTEEAFLRFDMSEFKEEHTTSKLIGSPPGYVGHERGGMLTNPVRERPFAVILFDEIEKAHPAIMDIFLQILGEGHLTDSRGQTVFFTETVIIFTSNLGTRTTDSHGKPIPEQVKMDAIRRNDSLDDEARKVKIRRHFTESVERFFMSEISRPELLNRIGNNIVPFNYIHTPEVQREIVTSHLERIVGDFEDKHRTVGHRLRFDPSVAEWLVERYGERIRMFGGKGSTDTIESEVMMPLSHALLRAEHDGQQNVTFHVRCDSQGIAVDES